MANSTRKPKRRDELVCLELPERLDRIRDLGLGLAYDADELSVYRGFDVASPPFTRFDAPGFPVVPPEPLAAISVIDRMRRSMLELWELLNDENAP